MIRRLLSLDLRDEVVVAQIEAFRRRVPILYAVLSVNTIALAATHYGFAPPSLSIYAPLAVVAFMLVRGIQWYRVRHGDIDAVQARRMIRQTTVIAMLLALATLTWGCLLYDMDYGVIPNASGITRRGHAVLYIGLTVTCCISLLMHVRLPALIITLIVIVPFCTFLLISGTSIERAVAVNLSLVALGMLYVLFVFSEDFEALVLSKNELRAIGFYQERLANTDSLTGLSNRRHFFAVFDEMMSHRDRFALLSIDLDGFKQINDVHGHPVGDAVLVATARRISDCVPEAHCVARLGGDEFCVIYPLHRVDELAEVAERIVKACRTPITVAYKTMAVGVSIGISEVDGPAECATHGNPIERADYALSHVKQSGRGRYEIFAPRHEQSIRRRSAVEQALRAADLDAEIQIVFQPIVCSKTFEIIGYESLARWHSPVLGEVSPAEFIPVAEQGDTILSLTRVVVAKALAEAAHWPERIQVKINLSARDIADHAQMLTILGLLERSGVAANRVTFELTETAFGKDLDGISALVGLIRTKGACLAIDDFGIGYSNLSYVHRLDPDLIKIDRSFVQRLGQDRSTVSIIKTVVELCRNVGARCLAEGVETEAQRDTLIALGVEELQGYLFGRPGEVDPTMMDWVDSSGRRNGLARRGCDGRSAAFGSVSSRETAVTGSPWCRSA